LWAGELGSPAPINEPLQHARDELQIFDEGRQLAVSRLVVALA